MTNNNAIVRGDPPLDTSGRLPSQPKRFWEEDPTRGLRNSETGRGWERVSPGDSGTHVFRHSQRGSNEE